MKNFLATLMALSAVIAFVGCAEQKTPNDKVNRNGRLPAPGTPGVNTAGPVPGGSSTTSTPQAPGTGGYSWGQIGAQSDDAVKAFLSTDFQPSEIGSVTSQNCHTGQGYPCAIEFTVTQQATPNSFPLALTSGNLITAYQSNQNVGFQPGYLTMIIWDSLTGTQDSTGHQLTPIPVIIPLDPQSSYVRGSSVVMVFSDRLGTVTFTGQLSGNGWVGVGAPQSLTFKNLTTVVPNTGAQGGYLGTFGVVACGVMACQ